MKKFLALSCVAFGLAAAPAFAQTTTAPSTAPSAVAAPTADQCKAGYKADYQSTMNWSKAQFDAACAKLPK